MRTLAGWIALTPELRVKLLYSRHVWDCAQHADAWGRRLPELRARAHESAPPNERFVGFMDLLDGREGPGESVERLAGVYRVLKPHLVATYRAHLAAANAIYEPPTGRILERCQNEERRHVAAGQLVLASLLVDDGRRERAQAWERRLYAALSQAEGVTGDTVEPPLAFDGDETETARSLMAVDADFQPTVVSPDLETEVEEHARALATGDSVRVQRAIAEEARAAVLACYAGLEPCPKWEIVAQAKVGAYRLLKIRLSGPRGAVVVLQQWRRQDDQWRVVEAEIARTEPAS